jgi:hypothetical protein
MKGKLKEEFDLGWYSRTPYFLGSLERSPADEERAVC